MVHRFARFVAGCTVLLVLAGSLVTSTGSGLSVPDWPTSYGWNMFTFPPSMWVANILYEHGHRLIAGADLAGFARSRSVGEHEGHTRSSARNRLRGIVTGVVRDQVMAQVELQVGPHRLVSLMSREAADELHLEVGDVAVAVVKSTTVVVELPQ